MTTLQYLFVSSGAITSENLLAVQSALPVKNADTEIQHKMYKIRGGKLM